MLQPTMNDLDRINLPYFSLEASLRFVKAAALSVQMPPQFYQEIPSEVISQSQHGTYHCLWHSLSTADRTLHYHACFSQNSVSQTQVAEVNLLHLLICRY